MESKKCRKVPIILYDGTLVKKGPGSDKQKCDQQGREIQLIPIKINFIKSSEKKSDNKHLQKSKITKRSDAIDNCVELKVDMMSSQALGEEVKKVPIMSSSHQNRDQHHTDLHNRDQYNRNQHKYEKETLTKMDVIDLEDKTETVCICEVVSRSDDQNTSIDWRVTQSGQHQIYKDLEVSLIFIPNESKGTYTHL